jgi:glycosyltransferase involved in cell wall biosynthesis
MEKGLGDILYALKLLPPEFQLLAVGGSDEDINFYQNQARELGVSSRVIWSGYLERAEVALMQKACDILLMNFPDHIHYRHYMSPLKMFEYMASCRPIISTDLPSVREILNEANTCFIPTESPTALAQVAQKIVSDRLWAEGLASQALVDVREHTWDKRCRRIIDFINRE